MTPEKYSGIYSTDLNHPIEEPTPAISDETLLKLAAIAQKTLKSPENITPNQDQP